MTYRDTGYVTGTPLARENVEPNTHRVQIGRDGLKDQPFQTRRANHALNQVK